MAEELGYSSQKTLRINFGFTSYKSAALDVFNVFVSVSSFSK